MIFIRNGKNNFILNMLGFRCRSIKYVE